MVGSTNVAIQMHNVRETALYYYYDYQGCGPDFRLTGSGSNLREKNQNPNDSIEKTGSVSQLMMAFNVTKWKVKIVGFSLY